MIHVGHACACASVTQWAGQGLHNLNGNVWTVVFCALCTVVSNGAATCMRCRLVAAVVKLDASAGGVKFIL